MFEVLGKSGLPDFIMIVVDNDSSGHDFENLRKRIPASVRLIRNSRNYGFSGGVNIGIKAADSNSEYFLLLSNDAIFDNQFLRELVRVLASDRQFGIAGPVVYNFYDRRAISSAGIALKWRTFVFPHSKAYSESELPKSPKEVEALEGSALLVKSEVIAAVGLLDDGYFFDCEDVDYCIRSRMADFKCLLVPTSRVWHKGGASSTKKGYSREVLYYITRNRIQIARKYFGRAEMFKLSVLYMLPVIKRLLSRKKDLASWQLRGIIDSWTHISGGAAQDSPLVNS